MTVGGCCGMMTRLTVFSSRAVNLALSLARRGVRTGILDTDIFGPSIPSLLDLSGEPRLDESRRAEPVSSVMSRVMFRVC